MKMGTVALPALLDEELAKQGVDVGDLDEQGLEYAAESIRSLVARLKARTGWDSAVGPLLTHSQVLDLTG